jgi:hypothetical protein
MAHAVLHEAVDVEFLRSAKLIAGLSVDPQMAQMLAPVHELIGEHAAAGPPGWWRAPWRRISGKGVQLRSPNV